MSSGKPSLPILKIFTVQNRAYSLNLSDRTITKLGQDKISFPIVKENIVYPQTTRNPTTQVSLRQRIKSILNYKTPLPKLENKKTVKFV
ncbi:hypothetical protein pb186bvf_005515 [Paramecium bursaria]